MKLNQELMKQQNKFQGLSSTGGICSLIFLPYAQGIDDENSIDQLIESACKVSGGFGQYIMTAFHPLDHPNLKTMLRAKGWKQIATWPSGHPVPEGEDYHMELWGKLTEQEPH